MGCLPKRHWLIIMEKATFICRICNAQNILPVFTAVLLTQGQSKTQNLLSISLWKNDLLSPFIVTSLWMSHSKNAPNTSVFLWTVSFQKYIYRAFFCWNKRTNYDHVSKSNLRINILSIFVCDLIYLICINVNIVNKDWYCVFNPFKSKIACLFVLTFSVNVILSP